MHTFVIIHLTCPFETRVAQDGTFSEKPTNVSSEYLKETLSIRSERSLMKASDVVRTLTGASLPKSKYNTTEQHFYCKEVSTYACIHQPTTAARQLSQNLSLESNMICI